MLNNTYAIILAADKGTCFHGQKQFLEFHGKKLWEHLYETVSSVIPKSQTVVVGVDVMGGKLVVNL